MSNFYVYAHINKVTMEVFYVGKGCKDRAFTKDNRNRYWHNIVNKYGYLVEILEQGLSESAAFHLEKEYIKDFKSKNLCKANLTLGGGGVSGFSHSQKTKNKLSKIKGKLHHGFNKPRTRKDRLKMSKNSPEIIVFEAIRVCSKGLGKGRRAYKKGKLIGKWKGYGLCATDLGISKQSIYNCLKMGKPTAGGYIFEYYKPT